MILIYIMANSVVDNTTMLNQISLKKYPWGFESSVFKYYCMINAGTKHAWSRTPAGLS